jgi:hypothetical protein
VVAGVCLSLAALLAAVGAASIGLRVSFTSDGPVQPLLSGDHASATQAVAEAVATEIREQGSVHSHSELVDAIEQVLQDDSATGPSSSQWYRSVVGAHDETLQISKSGEGESTFDVQWIVDALAVNGVVTDDVPDIRPLLVVSDEQAPTLRAVRSDLGIGSVGLPLCALLLGAAGLALSKRDRLRSLRVFALAAAATSVVLGIIVATVPHAVVTGMAPDSAKSLAGSVVDAITRPTLVSIGVLCLLELGLFGFGYLAVVRRRRQARPDPRVAAG